VKLPFIIIRLTPLLDLKTLKHITVSEKNYQILRGLNDVITVQRIWYSPWHHNPYFIDGF
jgi:hypothetical protein